MDFCRELLSLKGFASLNPPQAKAVQLGLGVDDCNYLVVAPTASGKSFLGELAVFRALKAGKKAVWTVPLRALASQIKDDLGFLEKCGFKTASSTDTDYDNPNSELASADVIVATNEKMDAWLRNKPAWIREVGVVVCDEVHEIRDGERGATIDFLLTRLRLMPDGSRPQIIALSATIGNPKKFAKWLGAKLVSSEWRSTKLLEGTVFIEGGHCRVEPEMEGFPSKLRFSIAKSESSASTFSVARHFNEQGLQVLVFVPSRKRAESMAREYASIASYCNNVGGAGEGAEIEGGDGVGDAELAVLLKKGIAFHHAGLSSSARQRVEQKYGEEKVLALFATTTLAAGMNLPAKAVIIADTVIGAQTPLSVSRYKQMCGRAGRPKYHDAGYAFLASKGIRAASANYQKYCLGTPEDLESPFNEHELNSLLLAIIQSGLASTPEEVKQFVLKTFFAECFGDKGRVARFAERGVEWLAANGLAAMRGHALVPTRFGDLAARLLVRPETAVLIRDEASGRNSRMQFLHSLAKSFELRFTVSQNTRLESREVETLEDCGILIGGEQVENDAELAASMQAGKIALVLNKWSQGVPMPLICSEFGEMPGNIERITGAAKWIAHAARALLANATPEQATWCTEAKTGIPCDAEFLRTKNVVGRETIAQTLHGISIAKGRLWVPEDLQNLEANDFTRLAGVSQARAKALAEKSSAKPSGAIRASAKKAGGNGINFVQKSLSETFI